MIGRSKLFLHRGTNTMHKFCVCETPLACTLHAGSWPCMQFVKTWCSQQSILPTTNIFVWSSNLKICFHTDCFHCSYTRKVFILWLGLKRKHYPVYIISQIKCTKNIFVWQSGLKTWFHVDCCHSNYQMLKWKVFFISWSGLKMFYS